MTTEPPPHPARAADRAATSPPATRGRGGRPGSLTLDGVLDAALQLVDEIGLPALSMRKLGAALGVDAMTIYGYVADKSSLVDALVERQARRLRDHPVPDTDDPFEILIEILSHYRRAALEHPNLAAAVAARPFTTEIWQERVSRAVSLLEAGGVPADVVPLASDALATFSMGFIVQEAGEMRARAEMGEDRDELRRRLARRRAELPDGSPEACTYDRRLAEIDGADVKAETFERGLRALLRGLRQV